MTKRIIGVILLISFIAVLFLFASEYKGLEAATIAWGVGLLSTIVIIFLTWLINGDKQ